jgi:2-haloalkanoic acid dehalogenase type II
MAESSPQSAGRSIEAVAFDCYGTLVDFGDEAFARAYGQICAEQGLTVDGKAFYDKWMEVWRRLAEQGRASDTGTIALLDRGLLNQPGPLSEAEPVPPHPQHHQQPPARRGRSLDGPTPPFRPYRDEWPEHFAICFEELGVQGDARLAYARLRDLLSHAIAFPESRRVVEVLSRRLPIALLSNADDDFLLPCLSRNGLAFPTLVSSESARAYKPHVSIFETLSRSLGVPRERIIYIGDSRFADVAGAKNAGMVAAWVNRKGTASKPIEASGDGPQRPLPQPDYELASLADILPILGADA